MVFAGSETTASTIAFTLLMLSIHQDVQDRVYREISSVFDDLCDHNYLDQSSLSRLTYMERVFKETMRLFPIAPLVGRKVDADIRLETITIPAGANICIPIYKLHRDRALWGPNAETFDSDNFLPEKVAQRHPYCHIPFIAGVRNCVGIRYSSHLMKVMLVHLLYKFRFSTSLKIDELELRMRMVLKIGNGRVLAVERRVDRLTNG
ncbi:probable cytochrome P450 313a4 [Ochlerotatus camptorhynchus]|uniref:probable cytochrome P450 313a4 n=1 Tax=Ochlerotatus camptorhynchus TaxID=644619 RepID=UPI0031D018A1